MIKIVFSMQLYYFVLRMKILFIKMNIRLIDIHLDYQDEEKVNNKFQMIFDEAKKTFYIRKKGNHFKRVIGQSCPSEPTLRPIWC